ncbi:MAG: NAD-dependent epimerase/dehydratase family protein [Myxococcota bacterium]|nr:NAD-dependent epimerase/dehydratase family protein [Myxococcota bacterium]
MRVAITGGTGFLGRAVVAALVERGVKASDLRVVARSTHPELDALEVVQTGASILDDTALAAAFDGVDVVYHLAGMVSREPGDSAKMEALHVGGTKAVLQAAQTAGAKRVVYASSSGTVGCFDTPDGLAHDKSDFCDALTREWPYYVTKIAAERAAWAFHRRTGFPVISMNPSLILGPGDDRGSSTGDVQLFLNRKLPSVPWGGISFVDVRDLAPVFVRAATDGEIGTRYLLGARNMTMAAFLKDLERLAGVKGPRLRLPKAVELVGARLMEGVVRRLGKVPDLDYVSAQLSQHYWYIDSTRASEDLAFAPRATDDTLMDTITYLRAQGG